MIPTSRVSPVALQTLVDYLSEQIWRAQGERQPLEQRWMKYDRAYRAQPEHEEKLFPFEGAANLSIPVIATDVDTIYSRIMGILFAPENLWSCRALNQRMVDYAPRLQEFLEYAQKHELGVYEAVADWTMELCKLGTGVLKQRYKREMKQIYQFRETDMGTIEQHLQMLIKDNPVVEHVSLYDFYVPAAAKTLQEAPWCAERIMLSRAQLETRARAGVYVLPPGGLNPSWYQSKPSEMEQQRQRADAFAQGMGEQAEIFESWLDFDVSDGVYGPQAIVATIHQPSRTLLRVDYNPFFNQEKPYSVARYLRQDKRFYGVGLAEMLYIFQEEITAMHNQRLDSATLANTVMFKARKGAGIKQDEPIIPGRIWLLENPEDLQPMALGRQFDSTVPYEQLALDYARKRSGVSDYIQGNPTAAVGYGAASTTMAMLREGAKRFDQVMREIRVALGETGTRVAELYQQFNQKGKEFLILGDKDGAIVHEILQFPMELIRTGVSIEVTATSASLNKEMEIRNNTVIMQMLAQYYQQIMMAMSYVINPQVPEPLKIIAFQMAQGGSVLMRRILDSYGLQDVDELIPQLEEALGGGQQTLGSLESAIRGGPNGAAGGAAAQGMAGLPAGLAGILPARAGNYPVA